MFRVDPLTSLGLSSDSITCYRLGEVVRSHSSEVPELLPCGYLVGDSNVIKINLKGAATRLRAKCEIFISGSKNQVGWRLIFTLAPSRPSLSLSLHRCKREQYRQPGVRHVDSKAHHPAVPQPADGAPSHHPLRAQRDGQVLPGCQVGRVHHFPDGAGGDGAQRGQLQRGTELQQGDGTVPSKCCYLFILK